MRKSWLVTNSNQHATNSGHVIRWSREVLFVLALLSLGGLQSFWVARRFSDSGYWDDTISFLALARTAPIDFWAAITWVLDQKGEFAGPYVLGIPVALSSMGLQSNWLLVLISNLVIAALITCIFRAAVAFGLNRETALITSSLLLFLPALVDQRTWFVPIQHSLTTWFALEAVVATRKLLKIGDFASLTSVAITRKFARLNLSLLLLALGREFGGLFALLVISSVLRTRNRKRVVYAIAAPWLFPILIQSHRAVSGRLGSHTYLALEQIGFGLLSDAVSIGSTFKPSNVLLLGILLVFGIQVLCIKKNQNRKTATRQDFLTQVNSRNWHAQSLNVAIMLLWLIALKAPSISLHLLANSWPSGFMINDRIWEGRWSYIEMTPSVYQFCLSLTLILVILRGSVLTKVLILGTTVICAPFLLADISGIADGGHIASFSRYAPYFLPAAGCITYTMITVLRSAIKSCFAPKKLTLLISLLAGFTLAPQLLMHGDLIRDRSQAFRSVQSDLEVCEFRNYLETTKEARQYLGYGLPQSIQGITEVLIWDRDLQKKYKGIDFELDTNNTLEWDGSCLSLLDLREVMADIEQLNIRDPNFRIRISRLIPQVEKGDDDVLRKEVWKLISEMRTAGLVE